MRTHTTGPRSDIKESTGERADSVRGRSACMCGRCQGARSVTRRPRARPIHTLDHRLDRCVSHCCCNPAASVFSIARVHTEPSASRPAAPVRRVRSVPPSVLLLSVCLPPGAPAEAGASCATSHHKQLVHLTCHRRRHRRPWPLRLWSGCSCLRASCSCLRGRCRRPPSWPRRVRRRHARAGRRPRRHPCPHPS